VLLVVISGGAVLTASAAVRTFTRRLVD
jgi:hypothetical protein